MGNILFVIWSLWLGCVFFDKKERVLEKLRKAGNGIKLRVKRSMSVILGGEVKLNEDKTATVKRNGKMGAETSVELTNLRTQSEKTAASEGKEEVYDTSRPNVDTAAILGNSTGKSDG